ncbi:TfoX/Sxy family DNA transformation protein [Nocardia huaxiensis]|uniref:TfoX/Sxy family DNA transformation protein n=1 Tax=Nocardia huaxiensis TaxID=2755382 RepID=A0A7D6ZP11_9NOCA|nr:TfoX/Sxy family DNA transformation protein [Nocardia huaxiensis]QLY30065.1 TfoX/Sxy family DNA transformation protein [Nocardia huaxiensis]UFS96332.1 TfoX/Sxy family protein [Nocardia huaxiensis]
MKQQRPATARSIDNNLKLHRHLVRTPGRVHTVITLRPGTDARFSTNRFHDTWHVLSDDRGAQLLSRLLWGLSYQARPGTMVLIDRPFLTPTPFDADPADPIVLVPGWCTPVDDRLARQLKTRLPLSHSDGTVRWHTFGLDRTLEPEALDSWWQGHHTRREDRGRIDRRSGLLFLTPSTPNEARAWALQAARLDTGNPFGNDYTYLDRWDYGHDGEIQIFRRFRPMVSVAGQARAQVLGRSGLPADPDALRQAVWREAEKVRGDAHLHVRVWTGAGYELGPEAAAMLAHAEVFTLDDLAALGSVEAYRRMRDESVKGLTLDMLWAMEAALTRRSRHLIDPERRRELRAQLGEAPAEPPAHRPRYRAPVRRSPRGRQQPTRMS